MIKIGDTVIDRDYTMFLKKRERECFNRAKNERNLFREKQESGVLSVEEISKYKHNVELVAQGLFFSLFNFYLRFRKISDYTTSKEITEDAEGLTDEKREELKAMFTAIINCSKSLIRAIDESRNINSLRANKAKRRQP